MGTRHAPSGPRRPTTFRLERELTQRLSALVELARTHRHPDVNASVIVREALELALPRLAEKYGKARAA